MSLTFELFLTMLCIQFVRLTLLKIFIQSKDYGCGFFCDNTDCIFFIGLEGTEIVQSGGTLGTTGSSGHKASFRSANKLARRARSFKEDLLERISAMRSPGTPSTNSALPSLRLVCLSIYTKIDYINNIRTSLSDPSLH